MSTEPARPEQILGAYLDRVNGGEELDLDEITREHPALASELIEKLRFFQGLGATPAQEFLGTLGDYTLLRQIGRGGMGLVYEAWQNSLERRVALKVLPVGAATDAKSSTRFLREAQIAASLSHSGIVPVYASGVESHTPYYAMEFVEGLTLEQVLQEARPRGEDSMADGAESSPFGNPDEATVYYGRIAAAFADIAEALQHAHASGVVHRDLKPSNLILDRDGKLRILDFGLARQQGQESLTVSGDLMGTVLYMSPEQAMAKRIQLDHRTDIYSLGATLYEALTRRPPFRGRTTQDTLSQIIFRDPERPRAVNARIPTDLETIVLKCLQKDPGNRYGTAEALAQDLRRFVRGDPIEARAQPPWERWARRLWRHRGMAVAVAVLVAVALVGLAVTTLVVSRAYEDLAERQRETRRQAYPAELLSVQAAWEDGNLGVLRKLLERQIPETGQEDLRCFVWRYYRRKLSDSEAVATLPHPRGASAVAFSPDGVWLASGGSGTVRLWDRRDHPPSPAREIEASVHELAFSPDSMRLAGSGLRSLRVWDMSTGEELLELKPKGANWWRSVAFSSDGSTLASGGRNRDVHIVDLATMQVARILDLPHKVEDVASSPSDPTLAVACKKGLFQEDRSVDTGRRVVLFNAASGDRLDEFEAPDYLVALTFSPDGELIAGACLTAEEPTIVVWNRAGEMVGAMHHPAVRSLSFSPDSTTLATGAWTNTVRLWRSPWEAAAETRTQEFKGHAHQVNSVAFSPEGEWIASASRDGTMKLWPSTPSGRPEVIAWPETTNQGVERIRFLPDGRLLGSSGASFTLWDVESGAVLESFPASHASRIFAVSPDGRSLVYVREDGPLRLLDLASRKDRELAPPSAKWRSPEQLGFSADGQSVFWISRTKTLRFDVQSGAARETSIEMPEALGRPLRICFSSDGRWMATGFRDGSALVWNLETYDSAGVIPNGDSPVSALAFSAEGGHLALGRQDGSVGVWSRTSDALREVDGHGAGVTTMVFSRDGQTLFSGDAQSTLRIWDLRTGRSKGVFREQYGTILRSLAMSPDGRTLASFACSREIQLWHALPAGVAEGVKGR